MANVSAELVQSLVDAGVHFGHRVSRWNPKMEPYIRGKRNMIHIIDVKETIKGLVRAKKLTQQIVAAGRIYCTEESTHCVRDDVTVIEFTASEAVGVTVVEGNHGGAKLPLEKRRSKNTFLVVAPIF